MALSWIYKGLFETCSTYNLKTYAESMLRETTNYGLRKFSYLGAQLCYAFVSDFNDTSLLDISGLEIFLKC